MQIKTEKQALGRARVLWGKNGHVSVNQMRDGSTEYRVGYVAVVVFSMFMVQGFGPTWDAAFEKAKNS